MTKRAARSGRSRQKLTASKDPGRIRRRLALKVRSLRTELGLTLKQASKRADIYLRHWQKVESGAGNPTLTTLTKLADGLGVEVSELLR